MATPRPRTRFTAAEYLAVLAACAHADAEDGDDRRDRAARDRALRKLHDSLSPIDQQTVARALGPLNK